MRFTTYIAGLLLLAGTGSFALPSPITPNNNNNINGNKQHLVARNARALRFVEGNCTADQQRFVTKAFNDALKMVDNVIMTTTMDSLPYKTFFDATQDRTSATSLFINSGDPKEVIKIVTNVFLEMKDLIETDDLDLVIDCGDRGECGKGMTMAWATLEDLTINFCDDFFNYKRVAMLSSLTMPPEFEDLKCKGDKLDLASAKLSDASQIDILHWLPSHTVVHELSHLIRPQPEGRVKIVTDCYYGPYAAEYMAIGDVHAAVANADNYAWFAMAQYLNTLCGGVDNRDKVYYRSWNDETEFAKSKGIFGGKPDIQKFKEKKAKREATFTEWNSAQIKLNKLVAQIKENHKGSELDEDNLPKDMKSSEANAIDDAQAAVEKAKEEFQVADKALDLYDMETCNLFVDSGSQVEKIMNARPKTPVAK